MRKVSSFLIVTACTAMLAGCNSMSYKKTSSGLLYKIITSGKDTLVRDGNIIKFNYLVKLGSNDSVLNSSYGKMPGFAQVMALNPMMGNSYNPAEIFPKLHNNDSAVVVEMVDSLIKKAGPMQQIPPFLKKGDKLIITFKVMKVYKNDSLAKADQQAEMAKAKVREEKENAEKMVSVPKEVEQYITDKKINAHKIANGTYVEIKSEGTGPVADSGKYVTMLYTGKILKTGNQFETNIGPGKQPFKFTLGQHQVIPGWDEGLRGLKQGTKATLYIPGTAAYGPRPGPGGTTYESLMFDVEVVEVADHAPTPTMPAPPKVDSAMHK